MDTLNILWSIRACLLKYTYESYCLLIFNLLGLPHWANLCWNSHTVMLQSQLYILAYQKNFRSNDSLIHLLTSSPYTLLLLLQVFSS